MTASNRQLKATVITDSRVVPPVQRLQIVAADNKDGAVISAGAVGKDALAALGLSPGFVGKTGDKSAKTYGLNLPNTLNLNDPAGIKAAIDALAQAMTRCVRPIGRWGRRRRRSPTPRQAAAPPPPISRPRPPISRPL